MYFAPGLIGPLSKRPAVSDVTLSGTVSLLVQVTSLPTWTFNTFGWVPALVILTAFPLATVIAGVWEDVDDELDEEAVDPGVNDVDAVGGVPVPLTCFPALAVELLELPPPNNLLKPRCIEQEESNKASTMKRDGKAMRFTLFVSNQEILQ